MFFNDLIYITIKNIKFQYKEHKKRLNYFVCRVALKRPIENFIKSCIFVQSSTRLSTAIMNKSLAKRPPALHR